MSEHPSCSYPVQVSLYAVVQDLCSQLGLCQLWPQERRLHTHTLHTLFSAQIPAESKETVSVHHGHQQLHKYTAVTRIECNDTLTEQWNMPFIIRAFKTSNFKTQNGPLGGVTTHNSKRGQFVYSQGWVIYCRWKMYQEMRFHFLLVKWLN